MTTHEPLYLEKPVTRKMFRVPMLEEKARDTYFTKHWSFVEGALGKLFVRNYDEVSFVELYNVSYNMVFHGHGEDLYSSIEGVLKKQLTSMRETIVSADEKNFLDVIANVYASFRMVLTVLSSSMYYVDEIFAPKYSKKKLFQNGLDLFNAEIVNDKILENLRKEVLVRIVKKREGENIDPFLVKNANIMLNDLKSYEDVVEKPLLDITREYYSKIASDLIGRMNVPEYIQEVHDVVCAEIKLVHAYLIESSEKKIDDAIRDEMVTKHMKFVLEDTESGFTSLLDGNKTKDLGNIYFLFKFSEAHMNLIQEQFKNYVFKTGRQLVTNVEKLKNPIEFISEIVDQKAKYDVHHQLAFKKDPNFLAALNEGFSSFADGTIQKRMAELLSMYVDVVMKKYKDEKEYMSFLNTALSIFNYLKDKDVFENYYKIHLSKRLLVSRLPNEKAEKVFIGMLRNECGYAFTSKIEGMFNDIRLSKISMERFTKHKTFSTFKEQTKSMELHVSVLTSSFWPSYTFSPCNLPKELQTCVDIFGKYYSDVHSFRKLTWQNNLGDGIMISRYPVSKHEIILTTYQMVLLLLFNESNQLSFEAIQKKTTMQDRDIKRNLLMLCLGKYKLIKKYPKSKTIREGDKFSWNADFRSGNIRIRIGNLVVVRGSGGIGTLSENEENFEKELANPNSKRDILIEKALIKILKKKKSIGHKDLALQTIALLEGKLDPNATGLEIKKRIESLIHREFVKRNEDNRRVYDYIA